MIINTSIWKSIIKSCLILNQDAMDIAQKLKLEQCDSITKQLEYIANNPKTMLLIN